MKKKRIKRTHLRNWSPKPMLSGQDKELIRQLHKKRLSIRQICKITSYSRPTIQKCLRNDYVEQRKCSPAQQFLRNHAEEIESLYYSHEGFCVPLQRTLKEDYQVEIKLRMLERFCKNFRSKIHQATDEQGRSIRFETKPGQQMQIDFGKKYVSISGAPVMVCFFVATLGYSRRHFVKAYSNAKQHCWIDGLESAFHFFGGVPVSVVSDNDAAIVKVKGTRKIFTEGYSYAAEHYGFMPVTTAVRKPRSKGKVERAVRYVKENALPGRDFKNIEELNLYLECWCREVSDKRHLHEFVQGLETPIRRFRLERNKLLALPTSRIVFIREETRKVSKDGLITIDNLRYALPIKYANKEVRIQIYGQQITVFAESGTTIELDKTNNVYTPIQQLALETSEEILVQQRREIKKIDAAYHNNPLQRSLKAYDSVMGIGSSQGAA